MDITLTVILVCFVVFFIAGFIDAIAGGGGLITMPVLLLLGSRSLHARNRKARFQPRFNYSVDYLLEKRRRHQRSRPVGRDYFLLRRSNRLCDDTSHFQ